MTLLTHLSGLALIAAVGLAIPSLAHAADGFTLTSTDIADGKTIDNTHVFKGFGCDGGNVSPALTWSNPPAGTKSFVLTAYDPDAPTGSGWWHWVVFDIPADTMSLSSGASGKGMPKGAIESRTDFGVPGYGGPCPPQGDKPHHYIFTVFALKLDKLGLDANVSAANVGFMVHFNTLGSASLTALYGR